MNGKKFIFFVAFLYFYILQNMLFHNTFNFVTLVNIKIKDLLLEFLRTTLHYTRNGTCKERIE